MVSYVKNDNKQRGIVKDWVCGTSGLTLCICICLVLLAGIPVVSAYDRDTASKVIANGYNPDAFTIEYIGYAAVENADINKASGGLLDTFYTKYHEVLPSRWGGREEPASEMVPSAYIFRVLPDGSTISYFDYSDRNESLSSIQQKATKWKQTTLANAMECSLKGNCVAVGDKTPAVIGQSEEIHSYKPYGKFVLESLYSWDNDDGSNLEQIFVKNEPRIEPGDYLHNHGEGEFDSGWFADQLIFKQYIDQQSGSSQNLPSASIYKYEPTTSLAGPTSITLTITDEPGMSISFPFKIANGDTSSVGSSGGSWVNWEEHYQSLPWLSDGAKDGSTLSGGMVLTCTKDKARNGNTYVFTKNVIYPNKAFKNLLNFKPVNQNNIEKYMTAKWYNGGWKPSVTTELNSS